VRLVAALAALVIGCACTMPRAPADDVVIADRTREAVAYQFLAADAAYTVRTAPRVATPEACAPGVCEPVHGDAALGPWDERVRPFTSDALADAIGAAGFTGAEAAALERIVTRCESSERLADGRFNAGWVNREAGPRPEHWAYGAAQVQLGWFDKAGIPREMWPSLTHNLRAAKAARDEAVRLGLPPFQYWACRA